MTYCRGHIPVLQSRPQRLGKSRTSCHFPEAFPAGAKCRFTISPPVARLFCLNLKKKMFWILRAQAVIKVPGNHSPDRQAEWDLLEWSMGKILISWGYPLACYLLPLLPAINLLKTCVFMCTWVDLYLLKQKTHCFLLTIPWHNGNKKTFYCYPSSSE